MEARVPLRVPESSAGERLDRFLATAQANLSRSRLQGLIREGRVQVNGVPGRAAQRLRAGDRVELDLPPPRTVAIEPEPIELRVIYEDDDVLVVDKPTDLVVHPGAGVRTGTLVHALLHRDPAIADVGGAGRPGIVHRLDRHTSGLLVVARTPRAYRTLVEALRTRTVKRTYRALVWGDPHADLGEIEGAIGRDPRERKRMAVVSRGGKPARTHWRVLERFGVAALLEVSLESGRTHQIRVHLAASHMPVVGDPVYGGRHKKQLSAGAAERSLVGALLECLPHQALHAAQLGFTHPVTGGALQFESPLPDGFARALELLRAYRDHRGT